MKIKERLQLLEALYKYGTTYSTLKILRPFFDHKTGYGVIREFSSLGLIKILPKKNKRNITLTSDCQILLRSKTRIEDYVKLRKNLK